MRFLKIVFLLFLSGALFLFLEKKKTSDAIPFLVAPHYYTTIFPELKSPVAVVLWLQAFTAWEKKEWEPMAKLMQEVLLLQPHQVLYYMMASWHMAWNASNDAAKKGDAKLYDNYVQQGRKILEAGIRQNPESSLLYEQLGVLLRDKMQDHLAASKAFAQAAALPGAPFYLRRFAAYELASSPGHEAEAYAQLQQLYAEGPAERVPAVIATLQRLKKLTGIKAIKGIRELATKEHKRLVRIFIKNN